MRSLGVRPYSGAGSKAGSKGSGSAVPRVVVTLICLNSAHFCFLHFLQYNRRESRYCRWQTVFCCRLPTPRFDRVKRRAAVVRALIVTGDSEALSSLRDILEENGHEALHSERVAGVLDAIDRAQVDLVIVEPTMPDGNGTEMLAALRVANPNVLTALLADKDTASLLRVTNAATDFVSKPINNREVKAFLKRTEAAMSEILASANAAATAQGEEFARSSESHSNENNSSEHDANFRGMYGSTDIMREVFRMISRVGRTDVTVLVTGESGTGKELVARALHEESTRNSKPFIALNCSALPSELVESELFGHTRGAFTGAVKDRGGLFEAANGGTLFLDEIGDLGVMAQAKVLRALENGEVMRVGGTRSTQVNVRVIAATNRPLDEMVLDGRFREDLLYRLKVITLKLPPLRERKEDLMLLVSYFLKYFSKRHNIPARQFDDEARSLLLEYNWPGNVRELRNAIEGAIVMAEGSTITVKDLPAQFNSRPATVTTPSQPVVFIEPAAANMPFVEAREQALREFDRAFLSAALARNGGNIARTARALGLHRQSLQKLLARRDMRQGGDSAN